LGYLNIMFNIVTAMRMTIPSATGRLYHGSFSDLGFGVSE